MILPMKICIFAYNFKHKKTQEGIFRLYCSNYRIKEVIAMNKVTIKAPKKKIKYIPQDIQYMHPRAICKYLKIPYKVMQHNSKKCINYVKRKKFDIGIILGARILSEELINSFKIGILNLHPGLLPENRGLDTYHWAVMDMIPQGATAHLIDRKMDRGIIIKKKKINIFSQDTLKDFYLRVQSLELELMMESLNILSKNKKYGKVSKNKGKYHSYLLPNLEDQVKKKLASYIQKFKKLKNY